MNITWDYVENAGEGYIEAVRGMPGRIAYNDDDSGNTVCGVYRKPDGLWYVYEGGFRNSLPFNTDADAMAFVELCFKLGGLPPESAE